MNLVKYNEDIIRRTPKEYEFTTEEAATELGDKLFDVMVSFRGVGLSATQIGIDAKMFVMGTKDTRMYVFNPEIISQSTQTNLLDEGCLTYPGLFVAIKRPANVVVSYTNEKNEKVVRELSGLSSRIFQHEYDHMVGKTFLDLASPLKLQLALKKAKKRGINYTLQELGK